MPGNRRPHTPRPSWRRQVAGKEPGVQIAAGIESVTQSANSRSPIRAQRAAAVACVVIVHLIAPDDDDCACWWVDYGISGVQLGRGLSHGGPDAPPLATTVAAQLNGSSAQWCFALEEGLGLKLSASRDEKKLILKISNHLRLPTSQDRFAP
jgi:hypothetical protein